jgi:hypothetical protein
MEFVKAALAAIPSAASSGYALASSAYTEMCFILILSPRHDDNPFAWRFEFLAMM